MGLYSERKRQTEREREQFKETYRDFKKSDEKEK